MNRKFIYYVDLPNALAEKPVGAPYVNVHVAYSLKEAIKYLKENYGIPSRYARFFITKGTPDVSADLRG